MGLARGAPTLHRILPRLEFSDSGCWEWQGYKTPLGYGRLKVVGRMRDVHRVAYELLVGPVPAGLELDHLCRNPSCANPVHLEPVTRRENLMRGDTVAARNAAKTHCPQGHPYDETNTYRHRNGRACRICNRAAVRRYEVRKRGAA